MRKRLGLIMAGFAATLATSAGGALGQTSPTLPSMNFVVGSKIDPGVAQTFYGSNTQHTYSLNGAACSTASPPVPCFGATAPEIVETARALKDNADTIFDFVHNEVETEFAFGERKGPLGTLIDKSGTPFDQNALFLDLVTQAGIPARLQIGQVTMTQAQFAAWTGVTDIGAACHLLASGGIPATFTPTIPGDCQGSGAFNSVTFLHAWSQVQIGGVWWYYDPSVKAYATDRTPVDLASASGFTAGAAAAAAASGMTSGASGGASYVQNVNNGGLNSYLQGIGTTLLASLKANNFSWDIDEVTGIDKIQQIWAPAGGWRFTTPPGYALAGSPLTLTCPTYAPPGPQFPLCDIIPDQYRTQLQVQMQVTQPNSSTPATVLIWTFFADDIDGRRIAIGTNFKDAPGAPLNPATVVDSSGGQTAYNYKVGQVSLQVDDTTVQTWSCHIDFTDCWGGQAQGAVTLTAIHPYALNSTTAATFANQTVTKQLTNTAAPVAIIAGFGMVSPERLAKWGDEVANDTPLPAGGVAPWICNSEGDYCFPPNYAQSSNDLTRQKLAASWLAQTTRMMWLQATIGGAKVDHQHSIGVVDWRSTINGYVWPPTVPPQPAGGYDYYGIADQFTDLNVDSVVSVTSLSDNPVSVAAISRSIAAASATLEGSVLEQMEDLPDTASTASRFGWGNDPGADNTSSDPEDPCFPNPNHPGANYPRPFFDWTGTSSTTRAGLYEFEGSTGGCGANPMQWTTPPPPAVFSSAAESAIAGYLAAGYQVTGSAETFLGPGARFGPCNGSPTNTSCLPSQQRGTAIVATRFDSTGTIVQQVAHVLTSQSGISKGGGGGQPESFTAYDPSKAADVLKDRFVDRSVALGVDLKTGAAGYATPSLVSVGVGQAPYRLDYSLSYKAAPTGCNSFGPCVNPITGGWNQNWDVRFTSSGSGEEALGATSPLASAGTLVAFLVMQDMFAGSLPRMQQDVFATLAADWWRRQMVANVATVSQGFSGRQYVRLVDGTWMAPVGAPGTLVQTGQRVKERLTCHSYGSGWNLLTSRDWNISAVSFVLTNAGGDAMTFSHWSWIYAPGGNDNVCETVRGYEPVGWTWPQGVSLAFTYGADVGGLTDYTAGVTAITTSLGRTMSFVNGLGGLTGYTATAATAVSGRSVTVGQLAQGSDTAIVDAQGSSTGGATGAAWNFTYTPILTRTATERPVPYPQLFQVFDPVSPTLPALQYGYDSRGLVETAYDADGLQLPANAGLAPYTWYLATGGRGERDDPDAGAYTVWYDTDGDAVRNIDEIGRETDSAWDGRHRVTSRTFPEGDEEVFAYDGLDNVLSLERIPKPGSPLAPTIVSATYETSWNHLATITDAMGRTTSFAYYPATACGTQNPAPSMMCQARRPTVDGVNPVYLFQYDAIGLMTWSQDAAGVTTTHAYDGFGNLTSTTEGAAAVGSAPALGLTTTFTPDAIGDVTATTTPLGHVANATFDFDRRKLMEIDPDPGTGSRATTNTTYDADGRVIEVDKGTTLTATGAFTAAETTTTAFDPNGNKVLVEVLNGPAGNPPLTAVQTSYDALNRPVCAAERNNAAAFAALPLSACAQGPGGAYGPDHISELAYDLAGQKLSETRGVGTPIQGLYGTWTYGGDGEVLTLLDADGNLTTNTWDGFNRLSQVNFPMTAAGSGASDPNDFEAYAYDADDNRLTLAKRDGTTVITYRYDALNRRTQKLFNAGQSALDVAYAYDLAGRPLSALYENVTGTPGVAWSYDAAGRRIGEATNGLALAFAYDSDSNPRTLTFPEGSSFAFAYDTADRFEAVSNSAVSLTAGYDALSRVNALTRGSGGSTSAIGYDDADRMSRLAHLFTPTTANETWTLAFTDGGQLASSTSANPAWDWQAASAAPVATIANGLNQNASVGGTAWTYDRNGNLTSDGARTFAYDPENRLVSESGPIAMTLAYDPTGRLEQSVINGATTSFLYDGDALVAEYDGSGNVLRRYVHGPEVDNPLIWFEGPLLTAPHANYLIADRQGSIAGVANSSGALTANYTYDAYGVPGAWGAIGTDPRFRYTGQIAIPEAQLYYYKARIYDPASGKFLQTDPVGDESDLNLYAYVRGDPLDSDDATGLGCANHQNCADPKVPRPNTSSRVGGRASPGVYFVGPMHVMSTGAVGAANRASRLTHAGNKNPIVHSIAESLGTLEKINATVEGLEFFYDMHEELKKGRAVDEAFVTVSAKTGLGDLGATGGGVAGGALGAVVPGGGETGATEIAFSAFGTVVGNGAGNRAGEDVGEAYGAARAAARQSLTDFKTRTERFMSAASINPMLWGKLFEP